MYQFALCDFFTRRMEQERIKRIDACSAEDRECTQMQLALAGHEARRKRLFRIAFFLDQQASS